MCKKVGMIGKIPQYEFCDEFKQAQENFEVWRNKLVDAKMMFEITERRLDELRRTHCPMEVRQ
jgi:hypothetical protein